jgi:hypothetical protein
VIAYHELNITAAAPDSAPQVQASEKAMGGLRLAMAAACRDPDVGRRLIGHSAAAGLPEAEIHGEFLTGGDSDSPLYQYTADTVRTLLPVLDRIGVSADEIGIKTLESRIRSAVVQAAAQVRFFPQHPAAART